MQFLQAHIMFKKCQNHMEIMSIKYQKRNEIFWLLLYPPYAILRRPVKITNMPSELRNLEKTEIMSGLRDPDKFEV